MPLPTVPPLPADCRVETLAEWLFATAQAAHPRTNPGFRETTWDRLGPDGREQTRETARAVRALLEKRIREALWMREEFFAGVGDDGRPEYDVAKVDAEIRRALGAT